ncbi:hypothetical protein DYB25_009250 [Aphanomyces astaci]|uniref:RanBP2-type domain-containing protein n=1 Tax=Aphanomyces astaci TaxID=112090 RepID=A0A397AJF5_APHAT|nr:hypothetical protein DYB25_009250 [Aphanomyces astaci]
MGFCGECGAKDEGGKFCPECGALSSGNAGLFGDASTALFPSAPAPPPAASSARVDAERKATAAREMAEQARQDAAKAAVFFEETENRRLEDAFRLEEQQRLIHAANQREDIMARQRDAHAKREAAERQAEEARQRAIKVLTIHAAAATRLMEEQNRRREEEHARQLEHQRQVEMERLRASHLAEADRARKAREDAEAKAAEAKAAAEALRQKAMAAAAALEDQRRAQQQRALEREESRRLRDEQRERDAQAARATEARAQREAAERHADAARAKAELLRAEAVAAEANRLQKQSSLRHLQQQQATSVPMASSFQELSVQDTSAACSQCLAPCKASQKFCPKCGFKRVEAVIASAPAQEQRVADTSCTTCHAALKSTQKFCPKCGAPSAITSAPIPPVKTLPVASIVATPPTTCPSCYTTLNGPHKKFCPKCGAPVASAVPPVAPSSSSSFAGAIPLVSSTSSSFSGGSGLPCPACRFQCKPNAKFCPGCGSKFGSQPTADQIATMEADDNEVRRNMATAQARLDAQKLSEQQSRSFASSLAAQAQVASASRQPPPPTSSNYALF